jgi:hypothetical protein
MAAKTGAAAAVTISAISATGMGWRDPPYADAAGVDARAAKM